MKSTDGITRVNFLVEGETEETFVKKILAPHFALMNIICNARRVETGRKKGKIYRGGMTTYQKTKNDIKLWLNEDKSAYLTTMFDLYALPSDFPKFNESKFITEPYKKVEFLEKAFQEEINEIRFLPYLQLHEFEALLFSEVEKIENRLKTYTKTSLLNRLRKILDECRNPELINEGSTTAPSKRIQELYPNYNKPVFGSLISEDIGLQTIRDKCMHFNSWIEKIESLSHVR